MLALMNKDNIKALIQDNFPDATIDFIGDECSLELLVISDNFIDVSMIQRHRMVLDLFTESFKSGELHALSLKTKTYMEI
tara:strand:- start:530 stop:769 length:240 start_codon:yes stop_codon:yes gene_type:complete